MSYIQREQLNEAQSKHMKACMCYTSGLPDEWICICIYIRLICS